MLARMRRFGCPGVGALAVMAALVFARAGSCHPGCGNASCASPAKPVIYGVGGSEKPQAPEPYGGQQVCPVTGEKLGSRGAAVPVQVETKLGQSPNLLQRSMPRLFPMRPRKLTLHVCSPECAAEVQRDPDAYLMRVITARSGSPR